MITGTKSDPWWVIGNAYTCSFFFLFSFYVKVYICLSICCTQESETVYQAGISISVITKNFNLEILGYVSCLISTAHLKLSHGN